MRFIPAIIVFLVLLAPGQAAVTSLVCDATAEPLLVRSEGLSERLGSIVLTCTGQPGGTVTSSLSIFLSSSVTNRLSANETLDVSLTAETDAGTVAGGGSPRLLGRNGLFFEGFTFNLPPSGRTSLKIDNLRGVADPGGAGRPVTAILSTSGLSGIGIRNNPVTIGVPRRGLLSSSSSARIVCLGSPLPETLSFGGLLAEGTQFATIRVTEGSPTAFERRGPGATSGTRILIRYSGFPSDARLFVPDVIAGSSATEHTSAGDLGVSASGGKHTPSVTGSLLLARARFAGADGTGDVPLFAPGVPGSGTVAFDGAGEVALFNGAGVAVYEVVDSNHTVVESAHVPTFIALPAQSPSRGTVASARVTFAPLSTVAQASPSAPVPRYLDVAPELDCQALGDCRAFYFPRLLVEAPLLNFTVQAGTPGFYTNSFVVRNDSGGIMNWIVAVTYRNGSGWLEITPDSGVNNARIVVRARPELLAPGAYEAILTVDAGPMAGTRTLTVTLVVTEAPPPVEPPKPVVEPPRFWEAGNSANATVTTLVPGSRATLRGVRLSGGNVSVTFNGIPASILFGNDQEITLVVPPELGLLGSADILVQVEGLLSAPRTVTLSPAAPGIFRSGIFNQDGFANTPSNPELVGNFLQVFATGLPLPALGTISARIHDRDIERPAYAGPAPGAPGVQQVNFPIPDDLPAMTTEIVVCGTPVSNPAQRVCSAPVQVTLRR